MTPAARIPAALAAVAATVEARGPEQWAFTLASRPAVTAVAQIDAGWLLLTATPHHAPPTRDAWATLAANHRLPGGTRFALAAAAPGLDLRADVPLDPAVDVARRITAACAGLASTGNDLPSPSAPASVASAELVDLCRATSWPVAAHGPDALAVDLGVPHAFHQALVRVRTDGEIVTTVPLLAAAEAARVSELGRRAIARLLLRVGGLVRLVRPVATADPAALGLEVVQSAPTAVELAHAFGALAVACRLTAAETLVLAHDEAVARLYLQQSNAALVPRAA